MSHTLIDHIGSATDIDAAIATAWPARWAKANASRGASKRRNALRKAWRCHLELEALKATKPNARCANCQHCAVTPHTDQKHCQLDSDFYGYQIVDAGHVCVRWKGSL